MRFFPSPRFRAVLKNDGPLKVRKVGLVTIRKIAFETGSRPSHLGVPTPWREVRLGGVSEQRSSSRWEPA